MGVRRGTSLPACAGRQPTAHQCGHSGCARGGPRGSLRGLEPAIHIQGLTARYTRAIDARARCARAAHAYHACQLTARTTAETHAAHTGRARAGAPCAEGRRCTKRASRARSVMTDG
eukprot:5688859-Pleurochrysis_carterae.AAC.1